MFGHINNNANSDIDNNGFLSDDAIECVLTANRAATVKALVRITVWPNAFFADFPVITVHESLESSESITLPRIFELTRSMFRHRLWLGLWLGLLLHLGRDDDGCAGKPAIGIERRI